MSNPEATSGRMSIHRILSHVRNPLYRNGYALTFSSVMTSGVGFAYWIMAARYYTAEVVGANAAAIAAMTLLAGLAELYLDGALVRFIPRAGQATARLVAVTYIVTAIVATLVSTIFLIGLDIWSPALKFLVGSPWLSLGFVLATTLWCIFEEQDGVLTGLRQATWIPIENATYAVTKLALLIICSYIMPEYGILFSWAIPTILLILPLNMLIFRRLIPQHEQTTQDIAIPITTAQVAKYAGTNYVAVLFALAYTMLPPILVLQAVGSEANAYFYVPWIIAGFLRVFAVNMSTSLVVEGAFDNNKLWHQFYHTLTHTARLIIPIVVIVIWAAPHILTIFGGSYATEGVMLFRLLALATIPNIVVMLYIGLLRVRNRISGVIVIHGLVAIFTITLSYKWLKDYGIAGVGIAWLASQTFMAMCISILTIWINAHAKQRSKHLETKH